MSFLTTLALQRKQLLDALEVNEGDINLSIFEDFYPDEAHFIYELLQNAEDAGASEVYFELKAHSCIFEHNGARHFDESDIRSITGIFNSSKKDKKDKIGKFGVGFKSVFVYTSNPVVYSKYYSFRIQNLVMPIEVEPRKNSRDLTRFEFPFDNPKKNIKVAYGEIKNGLEQLSETTLLFLKNIQNIRWQIGDDVGEVLRDEHSPVHIEVLKQISGRETISSHWLRFLAPVQDIARFTAPVEGVEYQNIAVAFELAFLPEKSKFDKSLALSKQLKIVPAIRGKVSVFFPAEKETSGLRFHLHAPFVPELSRASIKESNENLPLLEQLGKLAASSLHMIRDFGLLSSDFLGVLPHNEEDLPPRYASIRTEIINAMKSQPLVPTQSLSHAPGKKLFQSRAVIKALLSDQDLAYLSNTDGSMTWAIGANQRSSNQDKFLSSLGMQTFDSEELKDWIESNFTFKKRFEINEDAVSWIAAKDYEWHQALYAVLYKHLENEDWLGNFKTAQIVRTTNGTYWPGSDVYFPDESSGDGDMLLRVSSEILTVGVRKSQQSDAKKFLEIMGVKVPGEEEAIYQILEARYGYTGDAPNDETYISDLRRFIQYAEKNTTSRTRFAAACMFKVDSSEVEWAGAERIYIDEPLHKTSLSSYYKRLNESGKDVTEMYQLSLWYRDCGIELKRIIAFAELVGCKTKFPELFTETTCRFNPNWQYLRTVPGDRETSPYDKDYALNHVVHAMLVEPDIELSRLVWKTMCGIGSAATKATYRKNLSNGSRQSDSLLVLTLGELEWVPLRDGRFVVPSEANKNDLLAGFIYDAGFRWLEAVNFGASEKKTSAAALELAEKRTALGFETQEVLERAQAFAKLPYDTQRRVLQNELTTISREVVELPERNTRNIELRQSRVAEEARNTQEKVSVMRTRSVQVDAEAAKSEAKVYLSDQYTNPSHQMICQVCKDELPFRLPNGNYYFEAVEAFHDSTKRHRESYLCLCPNHGAAYKYANAQKNSMRELVAQANGVEIEISLGGKEHTLYFTQVHLADLQACLKSEEDEEV